MSMHTEWDDDSPNGRLETLSFFFLHELAKAGCFVFALHLIHLIAIGSTRYFKSKNRVKVFITSSWGKVIRIFICILMFIGYFLCFFQIVAIAWTLSTFSTDYRLSSYMIAIGIVLIAALGFVFVCALLPGICSEDFMFSDSSVRQKLYNLFSYLKSIASTNKKWIFVFSFLLIIGLFVLVSIFTFGICIPNEPTSDVSTTVSRIITRKLGMDPYCSDTGICYLYLLVPNDMSTQMHIIFHSTEKPNISAVRYGTIPGNLSTHTVGRVDKLKNFELDRYVSSVVLNGLEPGTTYYFQAIIYTDAEDSPDGKTTAKTDMRKFRTSHIVDMNDDRAMDALNFVVASDIGRSEAASSIAKAIGKDEPLFLAIGGDLAYENGYESCYCRYDWLLNEFQNSLITPKGYTIPILASIGNHEAGGTFVHPSKIPFFLHYFPYADSATSNDDYLTTHISSRRYGSLYHSHTFGNEILQFIVLDSGNSVDRGGKQRSWLEATLKESQDFQYRVALYHVPLYPGRRSFDTRGSSDGREQWLDLFDQYHLSVAFENHDHVYKRTHPLRNNEIAPSGTVYLGDGAWGVLPSIPSLDRWYIAKTLGETNYYMTVSLHSLWMQANAVDVTGACFDEVIVF